MKLVSLFSGIGGLDLGFERAGFEIECQIEKSSFCRRVLRRHFPGVRQERDVRECSRDNLPDASGLIGGFPCQDLSEANRNRARCNRIAGARSGLAFEYLRLIQEYADGGGLRFAFLENVPALAKHGLDQVLGRLAKIGLDAEWDCLSAAAVGAKHIRTRLFVFAYPCRERLHQRLLFTQAFENRVAAVREAGWQAEPGLVRVVHGVPDQVQRIRGLGNAVVPAVAEVIAVGIRDLMLSGEI